MFWFIFTLISLIGWIKYGKRIASTVFIESDVTFIYFIVCAGIVVYLVAAFDFAR